MTTAGAIDTLPELEGLSIQATNLAILAKSAAAKSEFFESAVLWTQAGRANAELAVRLIERGEYYASAQDLLAGINCFHQARDCRPAQQMLSRLSAAPLNSELESNPALQSVYDELVTKCKSNLSSIMRAHRELRTQMKSPAAVDRLRLPWISRVLEQFPGASDFHWFAARKLELLHRTDRAIEHYRFCARLKPENPSLAIIVISQLVSAAKWVEAVDESNATVARFPEDPLVRFFAGWVRLKYAHTSKGRKVLLEEAAAHFSVASASQLLPREYRATILLCYSLCERLRGNAACADALIRQAVEGLRPPLSYSVSVMIDAPPGDLQRHLDTEVARAFSAGSSPLGATI